MCFDTTKTARAKIAKEDIICWKKGYVNRSFHSLIMNEVYFKNKIKPNVKIKKIKDEDGYYIIRQGYHSYRNKPISCNRIAKFIIPKGTKYFSNISEYVSETLILIDILKRDI